MLYKCRRAFHNPCKIQRLPSLPCRTCRAPTQFLAVQRESILNSHYVYVPLASHRQPTLYTRQVSKIPFTPRDSNQAESSTGGTPEPWILVVDDEPSIRALLEVVLRSEGWTVLSVDGAAGAMQALQVAGTPPGLVICDVLMPDLDGLELVRRMGARIPGLNVIFISGHLTDISWWPADLKDHRFLAKPFDNAQLIAAARKAIGGGNAG